MMPVPMRLIRGVISTVLLPGEAFPDRLPPRGPEHGLGERWPCTQRPRPVLPVGQNDGRESRDGVDPEERPGTAEVAERGRAAAGCHPVRVLPVMELEPEAPVA